MHVSQPSTVPPAALSSASRAGAPTGDAKEGGPSRDLSRVAELDVLRGLAASGVVVYHYTSNYDRLWGHPQPLAFTFPWGAYGVQLFFMISGFVILMSIERSRRLVDFGAARFFRLYPAYWAAAITTFFVVHWLGLPGREYDIPTLLINFTMLQGFFGVPDVDGPYWTLRVELWFYIIMAAIFALGLRRHVLAAFAAFTLFGFTEQWLFSLDQVRGWWRVEATMPILHHAPFFLFGISLYKLRMGAVRSAIFGLAVAMICACAWQSWAKVGIHLLLMGVVFVATQRRLTWLCHPAFLYLGTISYGLYLIHGHIGYALIRQAYGLGWDGRLAIAVAIGVAIALGSALTFGVERPANRWLRNWWSALASVRSPKLAAADARGG